jgi:hypothetical protein
MILLQKGQKIINKRIKYKRKLPQYPHLKFSDQALKALKLLRYTSGYFFFFDESLLKRSDA